MSRRRDYIPLKEKLAAALRVVGEIPFEHAQQLTADQIISLFQFDHYPIPHAEPFNGPDVHWNLVPMLIAPHREKSAKHDTPEIAKTRRVSAAHEEFCRRILAKGGQCEAPPKKLRWKDRKAQIIAARNAREGPT